MRQPVLTLLLAAACGAAPPPPVKRPPQIHHEPPPKETGSFWQDTVFDPVTLGPVTLERDKLVRAALSERFDELPEAARTRLIERGVLAVPRTDHQSSIGEAYVALARKKIPFVITMDALFAITFRAIDRALDDVDRDVTTSALATALTATDVRLGAEAHAARSDTVNAYAIARGIVEVARKLIDPAFDARGMSEAATAELSRVQAHAGPAKSPLLGRWIDYGAFDTQAGLAFGDARIAQFRAVTWLERAALALGPEPKIVDVALARTHVRAAMLLSRATNDSWARLTASSSFAAGVGDDPSARELLATAAKLGLDLRDESTIANVVRVDKLRASLARDAGATVEDTGSIAPTFRLLSPSAPADARALARVESMVSKDLPNALAVGLALGSDEARSLLEVDGQEPRALDDVARMLPEGEARHASLHASGLDAIATYLAPSTLDAQRPWRDTAAHRRRKLEVALSAWATLRHAAVPFAHTPSRALLDEPEAAFDDVAAAIEPHAEALARLVSIVHQAERGLAMHQGSAAMTLLERVETLLDDALQIALAQTVAPLPVPLAHTLASMPARISAIERRLGPAGAPLLVVVASNVQENHVLEDATGHIDDVWLAVDVAGVASLFVGVRVPFYELATTLRSTDASWAKQLTQSPPPRWTWTAPFSAP